MQRLQPVIIAYRVSWSPDIAYADVAIVRDDANGNFYGRYDFTSSSAMEHGNAYVIWLFEGNIYCKESPHVLM